MIVHTLGDQLSRRSMGSRFKLVMGTHRKKALGADKRATRHRLLFDNQDIFQSELSGLDASRQASSTSTHDAQLRGNGLGGLAQGLDVPNRRFRIRTGHIGRTACVRACVGHGVRLAPYQASQGKRRNTCQRGASNECPPRDTTL